MGNRIMWLLTAALLVAALLSSYVASSKPTPKHFTPPATAVKHVGDDASRAIKSAGNRISYR